MRRLRSKRTLVACVVLAAAALGAGIAIAATTVVTDTTSVRLRVIQSESANGFNSGWHMHPGPVIVQVQKGEFKIEQQCHTTVVHKGETYLEIPDVPVRAVARGEIQYTVSQILPADAPPLIPVPDPCD